MKPLLLILALAFAVNAQDWKEIKEMSGSIPNSNLTIKTSAAEIARGDDLVKLLMKFEFPEGAPADVFKDNVPHGFDASTINQIVFKFEFNCSTLVMKAVKNSAEVYAGGKRYKSKEPPFAVDAGNIFVNYFCERGEAATTAPTLKP